MTVGETIIGVVVGGGVVCAAALIVYGLRGRGPKKAPRSRIPQRQPRRGDDNPFQDVVDRRDR